MSGWGSPEHLDRAARARVGRTVRARTGGMRARTVVAVVAVVAALVHVAVAVLR